MSPETIRASLQDAANRLASIPAEMNGSVSLDHATAQCDFWRLTAALEAVKGEHGDLRRLRVASTLAEVWESRRQRALAIQKADDLFHCRKILDEITAMGPAFEDLDD